MHKKIIHCNLRDVMLLSLLLIFINSVFACRYIHAEIILSIPHYEIMLDQNILIPINLVSNNPEGFLSWAMQVSYNPFVLRYIDLVTQTPLLQNYPFVQDYENPNIPGLVNIGGVIGFNQNTGDPIPTTGTGTLLYLKFVTKRHYPMITTKSNINITFPQTPNNSIKYAIVEKGSIKILPNLPIYNVSPNTGNINQDIEITIQGLGFDLNALPVIESFSGMETTYIDNNSISMTIPANTLFTGIAYDILITNPNGDFGVLENAFHANQEFNKYPLFLFGYPAIPPDICDNSYELITYINQYENNVLSLYYFDKLNSIWEKTYWSNNLPSGDNFNISNLTAIAIYASLPNFTRAFPVEIFEQLDYDQLVTTLNECTLPGLNFISMSPVSDDSINSYKLIKGLSGLVLTRLNNKRSKWESSYTFFRGINGLNFPIDSSEGYLLYK